MALLADIKTGYAVYSKNFQTLAEANGTLGLDPKSGLEGEMRKAVHEIEEILKPLNRADLQVDMLMMRRIEKDFIMRRDEKYIAAHAEQAASFAKTPADAFGSPENHKIAMAALDAYAKSFQAYAQAAKVEAQARKQVSESFAVVEPLFATFTEKLTAAAARDAEENERQAARNLTVAIGAISGTIIALFAIATLIGRSISRPIIAMTGSMQKLARGDLDLVIPGVGLTNELGQMASAVEVFRSHAVANAELEREAASQRNLTEEERRKAEQLAKVRAEEMRKATEGLGTGLKHLAAGDLAFQLSEAFAPDFETLRRDFNVSVRQLAQTLRAVSDAAESIDGGTREISQSADDLSRRTEQQAASLEETAAALDQITVNVSNSSKRADEARTVALQANQSAAQSGAVVANAVNAMHRIEESSNQISNIIGVIDEIAFQTNLLALNAGVEAARAGDAGKGFAVVAQEVRELAQRSAKAAKEIKELIRNSSQEVQGGVKFVSDTGEALKTIEAYIVTINQHMDAIATSTREQSVGLSEVNTAVNQMDQVTQQNAAMVEETNAASASLAAESARLRQLIEQFNLSEDADPATRMAA